MYNHPTISYNTNSIYIRVLKTIYANIYAGMYTKCKTPSPNFEELIESITNMLLFFAVECGEKSYEVSNVGRGGVLALNEFLEKTV